MPVGTYSVRIRAGVSDQVPAFRHFLELGYESERNLGRGQLGGLPPESIACHRQPGQASGD